MTELRVGVAATLLLALGGQAAAQKQPAPAAMAGASQELVVKGSGGGYEVLVSPTFVTVFYLPERVTRAFGSNQKDFRIDMLRDTVVVRPLKHEPGLTANLGVQTRTLKINVVLKVAASDEQAVSQVIFTRASEKAEIDRKVAEAVAPSKAEYERRQRELEETVRKRTQDEIAEAMLREYEVTHLPAITRNGDHVILRVPRAIRMGDDRFLYFTLQNRGEASFVIEGTTLRQDGKELAVARATFAPRGEGVLGKVEPGHQGAGILVVPSAQVRPGRDLELVVTSKKGKPLRLTGLRLP
jgi:hypothetical protein